MYFKLLSLRLSVMLMQNLGYFDFKCECDTFTWIRIILEPDPDSDLHQRDADPQHCLQHGS